MALYNRNRHQEAMEILLRLLVDTAGDESIRFYLDQLDTTWESKGACNLDVALVTGASSGIGEAFARLLAQKDYHVILVARRKERLQQLAAAIQSEGGSAEVLVADLLTQEGLHRVCTRIHHDRVDLLINNAGVGLYGPVTETDVTQEREMIRLHVEVPVTLLRAILPQLKSRRSGGIIQVGSTSSFLPTPYMTAYGAAKAFLLHYGEALAAELRGSGVTVTTLCPGSTYSEFAQRTGIRQSNQLPAERVARLGFSAWQKGKPMVVTGTLSRFFTFLPRFFPRTWITASVARAFRNRS
ncbi:short-subunit dehydrogenase [Kroppenstedtia sanguinis]|uniref:SDR family NAD(P)-dependent oxidoreductase n=1 Tax=Kroppenstedtia sanguinis TaxID=1380684 RepID=A0ABW4CCH3_9BACL